MSLRLGFNLLWRRVCYLTREGLGDAIALAAAVPARGEGLGHGDGTLASAAVWAWPTPPHPKPLPLILTVRYMRTLPFWSGPGLPACPPIWRTKAFHIEFR